MDIIENVKEGLKSINANKLRTILTAAIIAIGITSLVGILTAIDAIQVSINDSFSNIGANTFDVERKRVDRGSSQGRKAKVHPPIKYDELARFKDQYNGPGVVSINTVVSWNAEVKYRSKVTNPNIMIRGGDENFLIVDGYDVKEGRSFSQIEIENGAYVAIIGNEIVEALFDDGESPVGKKISILGNKFLVLGTLQEQGGVGGGEGGGVDRRTWCQRRQQGWSAMIEILDGRLRSRLMILLLWTRLPELQPASCVRFEVIDQRIPILLISKFQSHFQKDWVK